MPRAQPPPAVPLPAGIPTYAFVHGRYPWPRAAPPVLHLFRDWDFFLVEAGEATWTFADGRVAVAGAGDLALLPPLVPAHVSESRRGLVFRFCHVEFRRPIDHPRARERAFAGPAADALVPLAIAGREAPAAVAAYRELARIADDASGPPWRLERAVIGLVAAIAEHAVRRGPSSGGAAPRATAIDPRVAAVRQAIEGARPRAWRVGELARSVGVSPDRLNALFRAATGHGVKHAIVEARLRRALRLLLERQDASVRSIAEQAGFASQHFFSRQFRTRYGEAPLAYRRRALASPG